MFLKQLHGHENIISVSEIFKADNNMDIRDGQIYEAPDKFEKLIWEHGTSLEGLHTDILTVLDGDPSV